MSGRTGTWSMRTVRDVSILAIACFFAVMWGVTLRERISFGPTPAVTPRYDGLLAPDEERKEILVGVYFGNYRVGHANTTIERTASGTIYVRGTATAELGGLSRLILPDLGDVDLSMNFLADPFLPISGLSDLTPEDVGETWSLQFINPLMGRMEKVVARVDEYRDVKTDAGTMRAFKVVFQSGKFKWHSWVKDDGEVLIQGTPFGLTLRRDDLPPQILGALLHAPPAESARERAP